MCLYAREVSAMGMDIIDKAEQMVESENGYLSSLDEDTTETGYILQDSIQPITLTAYDMEDSENNTENSPGYEDYNENSESDISDSEIMNEDQYRIMIIFCFGLLAGILAGHFLTGFIK